MNQQVEWQPFWSSINRFLRKCFRFSNTNIFWFLSSFFLWRETERLSAQDFHQLSLFFRCFFFKFFINEWIYFCLFGLGKQCNIFLSCPVLRLQAVCFHCPVLCLQASSDKKSDWEGERPFPASVIFIFLNFAVLNTRSAASVSTLPSCSAIWCHFLWVSWRRGAVIG